jgi:hypothetical protein
MSNTQDAQWRCVLQERVAMIITLAHKIGGKDKWSADCALYFPEAVNDVHTTQNCQITCLELQSSEFVIKRKFVVKSLSGKH